MTLLNQLEEKLNTIKIYQYDSKKYVNLWYVFQNI